MDHAPTHPAGHHAQTLPSTPDTPPTPATPLSIRVEADSAPLTRLFVRALEAKGFAVTQAVRSSRACTICHRANPMPPGLEHVIAVMRPFRFVLWHEPQLDVDAALRVGRSEDHALSHWQLRLRSDDPGFAATACRLFSDAGFTIKRDSEHPSFIAAPTLRYGGADEHARTLVSWLTQQLGCEPPQQIKAWGDHDHDLYLDLPPAAAAMVPLRRRIQVTLRADTPEALAAIEPPLRRAGFTRIGFEQLAPDEDSRLRLDPGALASLDKHLEVADLVRALDEAGRTLDIDWGCFPLEIPSPDLAPESGVVIDIPLAAMRGGLLRPWSRLQPGRYEVVISDDDRAAGAELEQQLRAAGFNAHRRRLTKITEGFAVRCGNRVPESLQQKVRGLVDLAMLRCGAADYVLANSGAEGEKLEIEFAAGAHRDGRLRAELGDPGRYAVKIIAPSAVSAKPLADDLRSHGFHKLRVEVDSDDDPVWIKYGGARPEILDLIDAAVTRHYSDIVLPREKVWPASDHDVFIRLPASIAAETSALSAASKLPSKLIGRVRQALDALAGGSLPIGGPLVEVSEREVRVGDIVLPKSPAAGLRPREVPPARFDGFCIDQGGAETLYFVAQAVRGHYPAALEGPTAASKTWAICYLAAQLGADVYRMNLSGQSDVSDLIGRFVPDTERVGGFRFAYGPAPRAMTEGAWLLLDELNLAPSEVAERTNSMLEMPDPSLTLAEYDGRRIADIHPQFRVLATWNGLAYVGRQGLSPALLDRFKTRICAAPGESDYRALGECLAFGRQPEVVINGVRYSGGADRPLLPELATRIADFGRLNIALARFQAGIAAMADRGELRTRGPLAFTRRAYVDALRETHQLLLAAGNRQSSRPASIRAVWRALRFCHLERLESVEERPKAVALLAACGIGPDTWDLPK